MGMDVRIVAPEAVQPTSDVLAAALGVASATGARITVTDDLDGGVAGVDVVNTDVWVSMGEPKSVWAERIQLLLPYQVNADLLRRTGNPAVRFMHCLPAYHDLATAVGRDVHAEFGLTALEVTHDVFEGPASIVFDQAENRLHSIKAILVATLADGAAPVEIR
jgi:ornithine carbamoyltransferase